MTAKDLKNALLQEAVQGKLVPQIASEGNARDLLEEIRKEKLSHGLDFANAKSGKRKPKKETALAGSNPCGISEEEIPFEIPESWCWCRLGEIAEACLGKMLDKDKNLGTPRKYLRNLNVRWFSLDMSDILEMKIKDSELERFSVQKGDLLICEGGYPGRAAIWTEDYSICFQKAVHRVRFYGMPDMNKYFNFYLFLIAENHNLDKYITGSGIQHLTGRELIKIPIPLPPLAEQKRIVATIEKFMPLIEEYGKKETELKALNEQIGTLTKKAILQEAVQGKLVPQIAAEGNAKDLLEEIKKEKAKFIKEGKIKKEKPLPEITEDEIPFDIPENWCWCRLGEICNEIKRGKSPKYADKSNYLAFAQKCNVKTGGIDLGLALYLDENSITRYSETDNLVQGDIVINSTGGGTMGRVGLYETQVPAGIKGVYPDSHVTVIRSIGNINQHYLYYVLKLNQPELEKCGTGSTNQTELKPAVLADFVIPLPPLAEQKRIVAAIEKMLPLCEKLGE